MAQSKMIQKEYETSFGGGGEHDTPAFPTESQTVTFRDAKVTLPPKQKKSFTSLKTGDNSAVMGQSPKRTVIF